MATKVQFRRDTAAVWTSVNPTLADGEVGFERDTGKFKLGDAVTAWNSLAYAVVDGVDGAGMTPATVGFTVAGGTTSKTLTVTADVTLAAQPAILGANTFTGAQTFSDQQTSRQMLIDCGYTFLDKGNSGTTAQTLDYTAGSHQKITTTGAFTLSTSNWPPSGNLGEMLLELVNGASATITWSTINWIKSDGTVTTTFSANGVTLQASGTDWVCLWTRDAGTTIYGKVVR